MTTDSRDDNADPNGRDRDPVIGVSVDRERMIAGLVAPDGEVLVRDRVSTPTQDWWRGLQGLVGRVMAATPEGARPPAAVGAACIGPVDVPSGTVNPMGWRAGRSVPLASRLYELVSLPVYLSSTATAAAEAIRRYGEQERENFAVVLLDASVESACVVGGQHLFGAHGNAGSIAHVIVDPGGKPCWCGSTGCATPYLSAAMLEQEMTRALRRATPAIVERTGIMLGRAVASLLAIVDVETVFVSGHVVDQLDAQMLEIARRELALRSRIAHTAQAEIVEFEFAPSPLVSAAAVALGAAVEPVDFPPDPDEH